MYSSFNFLRRVQIVATVGQACSFSLSLETGPKKTSQIVRSFALRLEGGALSFGSPN